MAFTGVCLCAVFMTQKQYLMKSYDALRLQNFFCALVVQCLSITCSQEEEKSNYQIGTECILSQLRLNRFYVWYLTAYFSTHVSSGNHFVVFGDIRSLIMPSSLHNKWFIDPFSRDMFTPCFIPVSTCASPTASYTTPCSVSRAENRFDSFLFDSQASPLANTKPGIWFSWARQKGRRMKISKCDYYSTMRFVWSKS